MRQREAATAMRSRKKMSWSGWQRAIGRYCWVQGRCWKGEVLVSAFTGTKYTENRRHCCITRAYGTDLRRPAPFIDIHTSSSTRVKLFPLSRVGPSILCITSRCTKSIYLRSEPLKPREPSPHALSGLVTISLGFLRGRHCNGVHQDSAVDCRKQAMRVSNHHKLCPITFI